MFIKKFITEPREAVSLRIDAYPFVPCIVSGKAFSQCIRRWNPDKDIVECKMHDGKWKFTSRCKELYTVHYTIDGDKLVPATLVGAPFSSAPDGVICKLKRHDCYLFHWEGKTYYSGIPHGDVGPVCALQTSYQDYLIEEVSPLAVTEFEFWEE